ncbi:GCN5-related N-acetyltransferase [Oscillochloris trichoides DG-6]|uniref:GCN5-related N-acetyltransferase n=1 Tax=Oscillochloris trichoides DG-6 TaxID=765420 RepID=E1IDU9_9CHLR|nr:GNAT family N-acetyltransferase [Oscillochloris trichoides]EFO80634.1 GCN5-related N-acetyltransferase [Oscillochloris trichoides DG-6]
MSLKISTPAALDDPTFVLVTDLVARCNQAEHLDLPISTDLGRAGDLLLADLDGELVGVATISLGREAEICLCVDPRHRRQGIGRALAVASAMRANAEGCPEPLFVVDLAAESGRVFVARLGAQLGFAEHRMDLDLTRVPAPLAPLAGLHIRPANFDDAPTISTILTTAFGDPPELVGHFVTERLASRFHRFLLAELDGQPVATLRLIHEDGWAYITTFGVHPNYQGRGIGRQMLCSVINLLRNEGQGSIRIEVETHNSAALTLYESCGFIRRRTFAYYRLARDMVY